MRERHQIGELTRRRALMLAGGFGMAPLSGTFAAAADPNAPITTRPIPSSGERLPWSGSGRTKIGARIRLSAAPRSARFSVRL
jgi:hypothetical protein